MNFEETTRKMADEVARVAIDVGDVARSTRNAMHEPSVQRCFDEVARLAAVVEKLARCVARRFPGTPDGDS